MAVKAAAAEARLAKWAELTAERVRTFDPKFIEALDGEAATARKAVEVADKALEMLRFATERVGGRQLACDQARSALERYQRACADVMPRKSCANRLRITGTHDAPGTGEPREGYR